MVMGLAIPVFATGSITSGSSANVEQKVFNGESYSATQDFENVFVSESGEYLLRLHEDSEDGTAFLNGKIPTGKEILIPVERIDADFSDVSSILAFSKLRNIPQVIIDDLNQNYENYLTINDTEYVPHVTLFAPISSASRVSTSPDYKTIDGFRMKTYQVNYKSQSTGWKNVKKGTKTKDTAKLVTDTIIAGMSLGSSPLTKTLSFFASGASALQNFLDYTALNQNQISGSTSDYFQMRFVFDKINQYTATDYGNPGSEDYQVQLITYKVTIRQIGSEVYFANTNKDPVTVDRTCHTEITSGHFDDPWETAFKRGQQNPGYEDISYTTGGVTFTFER